MSDKWKIWREVARGTYNPETPKGDAKKYHRFGYNLGFGAKPWMKKYGAVWQWKLAQDILQGKGDPKRPWSREMYKEAAAFIVHNQSLFQDNKYSNVNFRLGGVPHHSLLEKTYSDLYRFQVVYGNKKLIDPKVQNTLAQLKEEIKWATGADRKRLRALAESIKDRASRKAWEVAASKEGLIKTTANPAFDKEIREVKQFVKERNIDIIKMQMMKLGIKNDMIFDSTYDFRDAGVSIGMGRDLSEDDSDRDFARLAKYLKKARWIRGAVFRGIMKPGRDRVRRYLYRALGSKKYREFFLSYNAPLKYSTDAYFEPRSEYGHMKQYYDNKKGEMSPLQRRRSFNRAGREIIKWNK